MALAHAAASVKNSAIWNDRTMTTERRDIVIVGASFAGLGLAIALRKSLGRDLSLMVLDTAQKTVSATPDQRAFALSAASVHLLTAIGIWQRVSPLAQPVKAITLTAGRMASPLRQSLLSYNNSTDAGEPASYILPANTLREALRAAAVEEGVSVVDGVAICKITTSATELLAVAMDSRSFASRLMVAADGRRSPTRELAGIKSISWAYPQSAIVTTVRHTADHGGIAVQHFLEAGPFAILPLTGGHRSSLVWSEERKTARRIMALDEADFHAELAKRFGGVLGTIELDGPRVDHPLEFHLVRNFVADRLAVIGDAARGVHPIAGQGLNLGLRDVAALTQVVVESSRLGLDVGSLGVLGRYEQWRRFDSAVSAAAMDGLNRLFSNDNPVLRNARTISLGIIDRMPGLKRLFVDEAAGLTGDLPKLLAGTLP